MKLQAKRRTRGPATVAPKRSAKSAKPGMKAVGKKRKPVKAAGRLKPVAKHSPPASPKSVPPVAVMSAEEQQRLYDNAVRLFNEQKFDKADAYFRDVQAGPDRTLAHHARVHSQICQKRLRPPEVALRTAEDHYNYAITLMNTRRLDEAAQHLERALALSPKSDHVHYALAATRALQGNPQAAYERLKTAIELEPRNRILARGDADFAGILEYPPVASLLHIDRSLAARDRQEAE